MKRVLMIAFHFPPIQGSSGVQRSLRFARHLPASGWTPLVLTVSPRAYPNRSNDQLEDIPPGLEVVRAPAWDAARHLSIAGRYPAWLARPDRWMSWWPGAVIGGYRMIKQFKPAAIWSTYPIATAHRIGATLQQASGLPWIADFRDPMAQHDYPRDPKTWQSFARIEAHTVQQAQASVFTTPSALVDYRSRYPDAADRMHLIENGYDEASFNTHAQQCTPLNPGHFTLLHSGLVYPDERDPRALFQALALIRDSAPEVFRQIRLRFRAAEHDELLFGLAQDLGVASAVEVLPATGYREALNEMTQADALLVLQASNCNAQIPAKLYEYFRAGRPILALTDPAGDTAATCRHAGVDAIAPLDHPGAIAALLMRCLAAPDQGTRPYAAAVAQASRVHRSTQLSQLLEQVNTSAHPSKPC